MPGSNPRESSAAADARAMRRQLISLAQDDMLAPVEAIVGFSQMLTDDASQQALAGNDDLEKMLAAARELYSFVRDHLPTGSDDPAPSSLAEHSREVRHEIGNRLSQVFGYCQLLLMEEPGVLSEPFRADLEKIAEYCSRVEAALKKRKDLDEAATEQDARDHKIPVSAMPPPPLLRPVDPATVLVADDNQSSREVLARILERDGHKVTVAADGREALEILQHQEFDLVLLDFVMPGMTGFDVLRMMKGDDRLQHMPVIIVSALSAMREVVACIERGADDFLPKPVDLQLLRARVNACLERKRLREREFGQFFTPELARHFVRHPESLMVGREAEVSVLFCDIRQFSRISERLSPSVMVSWLSDVMNVLSDCVIQQRGVLVDYIGDELMAMWGAPEEQDDHAQLACRAAVDMIAQLPLINERWNATIGSTTRVGIGINTGLARVGNTGSQRKFKYGALGNTVNLASRVQGATKYLGADLLVTSNTFERLAGGFRARRLCQVRVINIKQPVDLYQVFTADAETGNLRGLYERALAEFEHQRFRQAGSFLGDLLIEHPDDIPACRLLTRAVEALQNRTENFDPVWELPGK